MVTYSHHSRYVQDGTKTTCHRQWIYWFERINEDPDLLPCHKLELVYKKGGCDDRFCMGEA